MGTRWACKPFVTQLLNNARQKITQLGSRDVTPHLSVLQVGSDPASEVYVSKKVQMCDELGIISSRLQYSDTASMSSVLSDIRALNNDPNVHGILVQLPLPSQVDSRVVLQAIDPRKDVDGFHPVNVGKLSIGEKCLVPCTPAGVMHVIRESGIKPGLAAVVGRSNIVGKPMVQLLLQDNFTPVTIHSRTPSPKEIVRQADLVIAAVGVPGLIDASWLRPGADVIDVGINKISSEDKLRQFVPDEDSAKWKTFRARGSVLYGDVNYDDAMKVAGRVTPVPGGVGLLTIAQLMLNCVEAADELTKESAGCLNGTEAKFAQGSFPSNASKPGSGALNGTASTHSGQKRGIKRATA